MQGLKNHFVFVDGRSQSFKPSPESIRRICDPLTGVGAEELIVFEPANPGGGADFFMRIYNPDGTEVEACVNATRCAAWIDFSERGVARTRIETRAGVMDCEKRGELNVAVKLGKPSFRWEDIPLSLKADTADLKLKSGKLVGGAAVNMGNPHAVFFVENLDEVDLTRDAMPLWNHPLFPEGTNVEAARIAGEERIEMKVVERPGMITAACGSGACATFAAAKRKGLIRADRCAVAMPAGEVDVEENERGEITLTGPVEFCFSGRLATSAGET